MSEQTVNLPDYIVIDQNGNAAVDSIRHAIFQEQYIKNLEARIRYLEAANEPPEEE